MCVLHDFEISWRCKKTRQVGNDMLRLNTKGKNRCYVEIEAQPRTVKNFSHEIDIPTGDSYIVGGTDSQIGFDETQRPSKDQVGGQDESVGIGALRKGRDQKCLTR